MGDLSKPLIEAAKPSPLKDGGMSLWSFFTFDWITPLMQTGYERPLEENDIFPVPSQDESRGLTERLHRNFILTKPSLIKAMSREWLRPTIKAGLWKTLNDGSQFAGPIFMSLILKNLTQYSPSNLFILAIAMYVSQIVGALGEAQYFQSGMRVGMQIRTALMGLIFRKSLVIVPHSANSGKVTNMISSDTESLQSFCEVMHVLWSAPLRIITSMVLLYYLLGAAALCGAGLLVAIIPLQNRLVVRMTAQIRRAQQFTDDRLKLVTETFEGIHLVKCYTWEGAFRKNLSSLREKELNELLKYSIIRSLNSFLISAIPVLVAVISFTAYSIISPEPLTAVQAFTALSLFQVLRFPLMQLPSVINSLGACRVSIDRITQYLCSPEHDRTTPTRSSIPTDVSGPIVLDKCVFKWRGGGGPFQVSIPSLLTIPKGSLFVVVGHTASGKSSFLQALLGLVPQESGQATLPSNVAYCPQNPWIFSGSVSDNITFNDEHVDEVALSRAIELSQLSDDLREMVDGVGTELGERGINLSGGQKHRISLARAIYHSSSVVLMDDPLSALDSAVANKVFTEAILKGLNGATRILVTNRLEAVVSNLRAAGPNAVVQFIVMSAGEVKAVGSYEDLIGTSDDFKALVATAGSRIPTPAPDRGAAEVGVAAPAATTAAKKGQEVISKEDRRTGAVSNSTFSLYTKSMKYFWVILMLYIATEISRVAASIWLSEWSSSEKSTRYFLLIYVGISAVQLAFSFVSQLLSAWCGQQAARSLHYSMYERLIIAPMSFFQATPIGRILNRFAKDVGDVDKNMAPMMGMTMSVFLGLFSTLGILAGTAYYTVLAFGPLLIAFYYLQAYYRSSSREIKRMDAVSRSPIYAHFQQIQNGIETVLAFQRSDSVIRESEKLIDNHIRFNLAQMSTNRWLGIRLEFYGGALVLVTALFVVSSRSFLSAGIAGLALSTALQVTGALGGIVRLGAMLENALNSVERIAEYSSVESEKISGLVPPTTSWPSSGAVKYSHVVARYKAFPVLRDVSFQILPGQKVGVVGRTGAGKTSLVMTLFRILEIESGLITIDGVDISQLSLEALRSVLGIIPQEPIVFEGSVRSNIDPFKRYSDEQVRDALKAAHLNSLDLDQSLIQGGKNLSAGQRQQVCLARVLLRRPKILVLDEATSSLDTVTDSLVVATIRSEFRDSTVITIAHRLHTIIDSDLILALANGELVEAGSPGLLANKPNGLFASLISGTGTSTAKSLRERAAAN